MNRSRIRIVEDIFLVLFCLNLAAVFAVLHFRWPAWVIDGLIGLAFLLAAPFIGLVFLRKRSENS